jgi:HEAT repeat protein
LPLIPQATLLRLHQADNKEIRLTALQRLAVEKNASAIEQAVEVLLVPSGIPESQRSELAWSLESVADGVDVKLANRLAASHDATVQRVGVRILRKVGNPSSIPRLIRALDAADSDTRISAVVGLSRITGRQGPSWRAFTNAPDDEKQKWKAWWQEHGKDNAQGAEH